MMRIAIGGLWHETNTFSTKLTTLADFEAYQFADGPALVRQYSGVLNEVGGFIEAGRQTGFELIPLLYAGAVPSGMVARETHESLVANLLCRLRSIPFQF